MHISRASIVYRCTSMPIILSCLVRRYLFIPLFSSRPFPNPSYSSRLRSSSPFVRLPNCRPLFPIAVPPQYVIVLRAASVQMTFLNWTERWRTWNPAVKKRETRNKKRFSSCFDGCLWFSKQQKTFVFLFRETFRKTDSVYFRETTLTSRRSGSLCALTVFLKTQTTVKTAGETFLFRVSRFFNAVCSGLNDALADWADWTAADAWSTNGMRWLTSTERSRQPEQTKESRVPIYRLAPWEYSRSEFPNIFLCGGDIIQKQINPRASTWITYESTKYK